MSLFFFAVAAPSTGESIARKCGQTRSKGEAVLEGHPRDPGPNLGWRTRGGGTKMYPIRACSPGLGTAQPAEKLRKDTTKKN